MCGRFTMTEPDFDLVCAILGVYAEPAVAAQYRPRFNVAPTDAHVIVRAEKGARRVAVASWGVGERRQINARSDTTARRRGGRCVVPADGFYEWQGPGRPIWFRPAAGGLMLMAGVLEESAAGARFAVVTTAANADVAEVHDRMPLILPPAAVDGWLDGAPVGDVAGVPEGFLSRTPVSRRVGDVRNDDPSVLAPDVEAPPRQGVLFK